MAAENAGTHPVRCDPSNLQYHLTTPGEYYYDSGAISVSVLALLSVFVALNARGRPHLSFASNRDMQARFASFMLSIVTATSTFIEAHYFEGALQFFIVPERLAPETLTRAEDSPEEAGMAVTSMLYAWSAIYLMVSLLCFRNSFLLLLTRRTLEKSSRNTDKAVAGAVAGRGSQNPARG